MTDRDHGAEALLRRLRGGVTLTVGVVGAPARAMAPKAGMPVGGLAAIHELGLGVPARPFVRPTIDQDRAKDKKGLRKIAAAAFRAISPRIAAAREGDRVAKAMIRRINLNIPPPLARETVRRKGHNLALVDTGTLRGAVGYDVEVTRGR